jgi:hypothetical protein
MTRDDGFACITLGTSGKANRCLWTDASAIHTAAAPKSAPSVEPNPPAGAAQPPQAVPAQPTPAPKPNTHDIDALVNIAAAGLHRCFDLRSAAFVRAMGRVRLGELKAPTDLSASNACLQQNAADVEGHVTRIRREYAAKPNVIAALKEFYAAWKAGHQAFNPQRESEAVVIIRQKAIALKTEAEW